MGRKAHQAKSWQMYSLFQKALFVTDIDRREEISAVTTKGSSNFSTV